MAQEIRNFLLLANRACDAKNYYEGNRYYLKVLEIDPENYMALFGKFFTSGMNLSARNYSVAETDYYLKLYLQYAPELYVNDGIKFREEQCTDKQQEELNIIFYRLIELGRHLIDLKSKVPIEQCNFMLLYALKILTFAYHTPVKENELQKQKLQTDLISTIKYLISSYHLMLQFDPNIKSQGFFQFARKTLYLSATTTNSLTYLESDPGISKKFLELF